jgi:hypothetical protein
MSRNTALMAMVLVGLFSSIVAADAHDSWISRDGYRNPAGEWCCGATDCEPHDQIATTGAGWVVDGTELIPYSISHRCSETSIR